MNDQDTIEELLTDFAEGECFVEPGDQQRWIGTRYWGVLQHEKIETAGYAALVARAATDTVELHRLCLFGEPVFIRVGGGLCRLYERPDGHPVVVNDAYASTVESFIGSLVEVRLMQGSNPLKPVCLVTDSDEVVGVLMPIRVSS